MGSAATTCPPKRRTLRVLLSAASPTHPSMAPDPKPEARALVDASIVDAAAARVERGSTRETLRPDDRLKRRVDFRRVQSSGRKIHTPHFVLAVLPRPEGGPTRLGITVTRKVAGAVGRNRVKRVMREVFRRHRELFPVACDVVAIAKESAHTLGFADVLAEIQSAQRGLSGAHRPRGPRGPAPRRGGGGAP